MLRASADITDTEIDLQGVMGDADAAAIGLPFGAEMMAFAETLVSRDEQALAQARDRLHEAAGSAVLVDTAGVAANFQRMVRIADSCGIPVDDMSGEVAQEIREQLDLARFPSARNSIAAN